MRKNVQHHTILRMRKVSSGPLLSSHTLCSIQWLADSEGPDQNARMRRLIWAFALRLSPKTRFGQYTRSAFKRTQIKATKIIDI